MTASAPPFSPHIIITIDSKSIIGACCETPAGGCVTSRKERKLGVKSFLSVDKRKGGIDANNNCTGNCCNIGGHHTINSPKFQFGNFGFLFFRILPPVRFYRNVTGAISRLSNLNEFGKDEDGGELKFSILKNGDIGFKELVTLLKREMLLSRDVDELRIVDYTAERLSVGPSTVGERMLVALISNKEEPVIHIPFDPTRPIRELKEINEKALRKAISIILIYLVFIWLILSLLPYSEFIK